MELLLKILFLGEIIGSHTVKTLVKKIKHIREEWEVDCVIANADGASDGYGILAQTAYTLLNGGIDIVTTGDLAFNKKNIAPFFNEHPLLIRPYNFGARSPGNGYVVYSLPNGEKVAVLSLIGRTNFPKTFANDPYEALHRALERIRVKTKNIILDFHAGTTSEAQGMHWVAAGKVSAVLGTNLRVLTSDNRIIENRTAVITNTGFCGSSYGITGFEPETEIKKMSTGRFCYSRIIKESVQIQGCIVEIDSATGIAQSIDLINHLI